MVLGEAEAVHRVRLVPFGMGWHMQVGEDQDSVLLTGDHVGAGVMQVALDGVSERVLLMQDDDAFHVSLSGGEAGEWTLRLLDAYAPKGGEAVIDGRLAAPIPGRVVQVLVEPGETVTRGQTLAVLEAMKTEIRITALAEGVVVAVGCAVGESVEEGTMIVEIDSGTDARGQ